MQRFEKLHNYQLHVTCARAFTNHRQPLINLVLARSLAHISVLLLCVYYSCDTNSLIYTQNFSSTPKDFVLGKNQRLFKTFSLNLRTFQVCMEFKDFPRTPSKIQGLFKTILYYVGIIITNIWYPTSSQGSNFHRKGTTKPQWKFGLYQLIGYQIFVLHFPTDGRNTTAPLELKFVIPV